MRIPEGGAGGSPAPGTGARRAGRGGLLWTAAAGFLLAGIAGASIAQEASPPFGFGRAPTAAELEALDIDVRPDGTGLPAGSGSAAAGEAVYLTYCASCHGPQGTGTAAGWPLVGRNPGDAFDFADGLEQELRRTIGNYWPYATTLFDYTRRAMPMDRPGILTADELYAVTAWMLWRNEIIPPDMVLDAGTLPGVQMPAAGRFIPDDRP